MSGSAAASDGAHRFGALLDGHGALQPDGRAGHDDAVAAVEDARGLGGVRRGVLDGLRFVEDDRGELEILEVDDVAAKRALVESESVRILRRRGDLIITETTHGFICANSGVDLSNVERGYAALLPIDSDRSARRVRDIVRARLGVSVGVIVSDTFGRPWRKGLTDVAIGVAGIAGVVDLRGTPDSLGRIMQVTEVAVADEIAAAAELVMGKSSGIPVAVVRGVDAEWMRESNVQELVRPAQEDLFR